MDNVIFGAQTLNDFIGSSTGAVLFVSFLVFYAFLVLLAAWLACELGPL